MDSIPMCVCVCVCLYVCVCVCVRVCMCVCSICIEIIILYYCFALKTRSVFALRNLMRHSTANQHRVSRQQLQGITNTTELELKTMGLRAHVDNTGTTQQPHKHKVRITQCARKKK